MEVRFAVVPPDELITHVTAICGERGKRWLDDLPRMVARLETEWSLSVAEPFPGGEFNFVAPAVRNDGSDVVVKISPPYERVEIFQEAQWLRARDGIGCMRLLAVDNDRAAILLERARPGEALFEKFAGDPAGSVVVAIDVLRSVLRPPPKRTIDVGSVDAWFENFRTSRRGDFPTSYADRAFEIYDRLSGSTDHTFYLHGDFHHGNILTAEDGFAVIDPKGVVGHIGYEISVFLNNLHWWQNGSDRVDDLLTFAIRAFSAAFGLSTQEVREWAFAGMVIGAWWKLDDSPELYDNDVALADVWAV